MNKALILSVRPQHAYNILNGEKTLELRKSVPKGFKGWVYVYVTKGKPRLSVVHDDENGKTYYYLNSNWGRELNATIPFRFWFEEYEELFFVESEDDYKLTYDFGIYYDYDEEIFNKLCLTMLQVNNYGKGKDLYAWHIKRLEIFPKPKELGEFYKYYTGLTENTPSQLWYKLTKAPQSYMYALVKEEKRND